MEKADTRGLGTKEDRGHEGRVGERDAGGQLLLANFRISGHPEFPTYFCLESRDGVIFWKFPTPHDAKCFAFASLTR